MKISDDDFTSKRKAMEEILLRVSKDNREKIRIEKRRKRKGKRSEGGREETTIRVEDNSHDNTVAILLGRYGGVDRRRSRGGLFGRGRRGGRVNGSSSSSRRGRGGRRGR